MEAFFNVDMSPKVMRLQLFFLLFFGLALSRCTVYITSLCSPLTGGTRDISLSVLATFNVARCRTISMEHFNGVASESLEVCCENLFPHAKGVITVLEGGGVSDLQNATQVVDSDFETFPMAGVVNLQTERHSTSSCDRNTHNLRHFINFETRANSQNYRFIADGSGNCLSWSCSCLLAVFLCFLFFL